MRSDNRTVHELQVSSSRPSRSVTKFTPSYIFVVCIPWLSLGKVSCISAVASIQGPTRQGSDSAGKTQLVARCTRCTFLLSSRLVLQSYGKELSKLLATSQISHDSRIGVISTVGHESCINIVLSDQGPTRQGSVSVGKSQLMQGTLYCTPL